MPVHPRTRNRSTRKVARSAPKSNTRPSATNMKKPQGLKFSHSHHATHESHPETLSVSAKCEAPAASRRPPQPPWTFCAQLRARLFLWTPDFSVLSINPMVNRPFESPIHYLSWQIVLSTRTVGVRKVSPSRRAWVLAVRDPEGTPVPVIFRRECRWVKRPWPARGCKTPMCPGERRRFVYKGRPGYSGLLSRSVRSGLRALRIETLHCFVSKGCVLRS
jgi:hypothetical protein